MGKPLHARLTTLLAKIDQEIAEAESISKGPTDEPMRQRLAATLAELQDARASTEAKLIRLGLHKTIRALGTQPMVHAAIFSLGTGLILWGIVDRLTWLQVLGVLCYIVSACYWIVSMYLWYRETR
jgi:Flp pilus assembly protein TadB